MALISPRNRLGTRSLSELVCVTVITCWITGCGNTALREETVATAREVVEAYHRASAKGDFDAAKACWTAEGFAKVDREAWERGRRANADGPPVQYEFKSAMTEKSRDGSTQLVLVYLKKKGHGPATTSQYKLTYPKDRKPLIITGDSGI